jgi:peptide/nickel transport system permease protein
MMRNFNIKGSAGADTPPTARGGGARWRAVAGLLGLVYLSAVFAGFIAPQDPATQHRHLAFVPPTRVHFVDESGQWHLRPFVFRQTLPSGAVDAYGEDRTRPYPVRFFVRGARYQIAGIIDADVHLFGTDSPTGIFLFGSDDYGRDLFSRLIYGGQVSLFAGLLGAGLSLAVGILLGGLAGYYGAWVDEIIMRAAELFLALPWLYLLFAVRMALPLDIAPAQAFLLVLVVIGLVGWARPARLVRGVVLSARSRDYVLAARCLGASDVHLWRQHVFPQVLGIVLTQAALLVPQYILAEVTLSFFGLGVGEPVPSWGNMLASLQRYHVLASYWWMFIPGLVLIPVFLLYYALADALHRRWVVVTERA